MRERNVSQEVLSNQIGLSLSAFNNKINGKVNFDVKEAQAIGELLALTDDEKISIFLAQNLQKLQGEDMNIEKRIMDILSLILSQKYKVNVELKGEKK